MTCEELTQLLPDLVDGTLSPEVRSEAESTLAQCPECQREFDLVRQVRVLLVTLQAEHPELRVPAGFEARLMAQIKRQNSGLDLLELSSKTFGVWLVELMNLVGGLLDPHFIPQSGKTRTEPKGA